MYLKMMLNGQVVEERMVSDHSLYAGDALQAMIEEMMAQHEAAIDRSGDQPQFLLEKEPSKKPAKSLTSLVSKLAFFARLFS